MPKPQTNKDLKDKCQLDLQCRKLIRECSLFLHKQSTKDHELKALLELNANLNVEFSKDGKSYYQKLCHIRAAVEQFKSRVADVLNRRSTDTSATQESLKQIEEFIKQYRRNESVITEALLREENELWQSCLMCEKQIALWGDEDRRTTLDGDVNYKTANRTTPISWVDFVSNLSPEIAQYEQFLQKTGGRFGGWTDKEHTVFLRFFNRLRLASSDQEIKEIVSDKNAQSNMQHLSLSDIVNGLPHHLNVTALHQKVAQLIGTKSAEDVCAHEAWWIRLRGLEQAKRRALRNWRAICPSRKNQPSTVLPESSERRLGAPCDSTCYGRV